MDVKGKAPVQCGSVSAGGSRCSQVLLLAEAGKNAWALISVGAMGVNVIVAQRVMVEQ